MWKRLFILPFLPMVLWIVIQWTFHLNDTIDPYPPIIQFQLSFYESTNVTDPIWQQQLKQQLSVTTQLPLTSFDILYVNSKHRVLLMQLTPTRSFSISSFHAIHQFQHAIHQSTSSFRSNEITQSIRPTRSLRIRYVCPVGEDCGAYNWTPYGLPRLVITSVIGIMYTTIFVGVALIYWYTAGWSKVGGQAALTFEQFVIDIWIYILVVMLMAALVCWFIFWVAGLFV